jgi:hypothetical protein
MRAARFAVTEKREQQVGCTSILSACAAEDNAKLYAATNAIRPMMAPA